MSFELPDDLKGTRLYFAYGSNMSQKQVAERGLKMTLVGVGYLSNYKFMLNKISKKDPTIGYANIIPYWGKTVYGLVYDMANLPLKDRRISDRSKPEQEKVISLMRTNLALLDKFEGYPHHYQRTNIGITDIRPLNTINCFTYLAGLEMQSQTNLFVNSSYIEKINEGLDSNPINEDYKTEIKQLMELWKTS